MANVLTNSDPDPKKAIWKFIIQTAISVLTAILTALGATSCVTHYFKTKNESPHCVRNDSP